MLGSVFRDSGVQVLAVEGRALQSKIVSAIIQSCREMNINVIVLPSGRDVVLSSVATSSTFLRTLAVISHEGFAESLDVLEKVSRVGCRGALVITVVDEFRQDIRVLASALKLPVLELSTASYIPLIYSNCFEWSEAAELPYVVRLLCPLVWSKVEYRGEGIERLPRTPVFNKHWHRVYRWVPELHDRYSVNLQEVDRCRDVARAFAELGTLCREWGSGDTCVISSGFARFCIELGGVCFLDVPYVYPFPRELLRKQLHEYRRAIVVEIGVASYLSDLVKSILPSGVDVVTIIGNDIVDAVNKLSAVLRCTVKGVELINGLERYSEARSTVSEECCGCGLVALAYALYRVLRDRGDVPVIVFDRGCLGRLLMRFRGDLKPNYSILSTSYSIDDVGDIGDISLAPRSAITTSIGYAVARYRDGPILCVSDGLNFLTQIHSIKVLRRVGDVKLLIVVTRGYSGSELFEDLDAVKLLEVLGYSREEVLVTDSGSVNELVEFLSKLLSRPEVRAMVYLVNCRKGREVVCRGVVEFIAENCDACGECLKVPCPAIEISETGTPVIKRELCIGCGICCEVCTRGALKLAQ
ncbi:MAG: hypothetical protein DRJ40_07370 [Thermoprotei archaeon]|nr:MAG: hypothetical protein DRJ40_07370 [Thermoprotei archaeon]